jgi:hypothetical protein
MESYFVRMTTQGNQATKLEKIVSVFVSLAETYVQNRAQSASEKNTVIQRPPIFSENGAFPEPAMQTPSSFDIQECATPFDVDISADTILNWFNYPEIPIANIQESGRLTSNNSELPFGTVAPSDIFGPITSHRGRKRPLEGDFDWLSWDLSASSTF